MASRGSTSKASELPAELLCRIAIHLSTEERVRLACVCSPWRDILHTAPLVWSDLEVKITFKNDYVASWPSKSYVTSRLGPNPRLKHLTLVGPLQEDLPWSVEGLLRGSRHASVASGYIQSYGSSHLESLTLEGWPSSAVAAIVCWLPQLRYLKYCITMEQPEAVSAKVGQLLHELANIVERRPSFAISIALPQRYMQLENAGPVDQPLRALTTGEAPAWGVTDFALHTHPASFRCCRQHILDDNSPAVALADPTALRQLDLRGERVRLRLCPRLSNLTSIRIDGGLRFHTSTLSTSNKVLLASLRHLEIIQPKVDNEGLLSASKLFSVLRAPYLQVFKYQSRTPMETIVKPRSYQSFRAFGVDLSIFISKARQLKEFHLDHPMPKTMTQLFDDTYDTPSCFSQLETLIIANATIPALVTRHMTPGALPKLKVLDSSRARHSAPFTNPTARAWGNRLDENYRP